MESVHENVRPKFVFQSKSIPQTTTSSTIDNTSTTYIFSLTNLAFPSPSLMPFYSSHSPHLGFHFLPLASFAPHSLPEIDIIVRLGPPLNSLPVIEAESDSNSTTSKKFKENRRDQL